MKRIILTSSLSLFCMLMGFNSKAQYMRFGVFADPQLSWFTSDTKKFSSNGMVAGFNAGFAFEKFFADRYAISSGASINNIGGNLKYNVADHEVKTRDDTYTIGTNTSVKVKGQYITVPLGLKFKTNEIGYTTLYAQMGINGHIRLKGYTWIEEHEVEREVMDNNQIYLAFLSYMLGAGIEYSLGGPSSIQLGVTYSNGMTPAFNAGYGRVSIGSLALRIGMIF